MQHAIVEEELSKEKTAQGAVMGFLGRCSSCSRRNHRGEDWFLGVWNAAVHAQQEDSSRRRLPNDQRKEGCRKEGKDERPRKQRSLAQERKGEISATKSGTQHACFLDGRALVRWVYAAG